MAGIGMITHFSHREHALTAMAPDVSVRCSVCKRSKCVAKGFYACKTCQYYLGFVCAMLEEKTHIPAHEQHPLTLVTTPATGNVSRICRACGGQIRGWRYSCSCHCSYDLHAACAHWPKTIETTAVHVHPLNLHFPAGPQPRHDRGINCRGCGHGDKGLWGYSCSTCGSGFFHHLGEAVDTMQIVVDVLNGIGNNEGGGAAIDGPDCLWELVELLVPHRFSAPISLVTQLIPPYPVQIMSAIAAPISNQTSPHHDDDCN